MATGTVQRYDTARGFGSITPDDTTADVTAGQRVGLEAESGPKGPLARSVRSA